MTLFIINNGLKYNLLKLLKRLPDFFKNEKMAFNSVYYIIKFLFFAGFKFCPHIG